MGKFHHSKKAQSADKGRGSSKTKYDKLSSGRKKLPEDFVYTQHHKGIWKFTVADNTWVRIGSLVTARGEHVTLEVDGITCS